MPLGWQGRWRHAVTCDSRTGTRWHAQLSAGRDEERAQTMSQRVCSTLVLATCLVSADILTTGELSHMTQQILRMQGIRPAVQEPARPFQEPPTDLALSATLREQFDRLLRFQRAPFITRVVFIAVPHRGSLLAESAAGRIGRLLIAVPATVLTPVRLLREQVGAALAPDVQEALQEKPTSIKGLSPHNPIIQALAGGAVDKEVPCHSIIGDRGLGDGEQGSDGVVPYKSAHLVEAESELIVPSDHAATAHPFTVLEVKRILRLHLLQAGYPGS